MEDLYLLFDKRLMTDKTHKAIGNMLNELTLLSKIHLDCCFTHIEKFNLLEEKFLERNQAYKAFSFNCIVFEDHIR